MSGKTIGLNLNNGYAGSYARQPDMIVNTRPNVGLTAIPFGAVLSQMGPGVQGVDAKFVASNFAGIAARQIQSQTNFLAQADAAQYEPKAPVSVFQRGRINVICKGTPAIYGNVYVRKVEAPGKAIGDLETTPDGDNNVLLSNCQWGGSADANGVAELVILSSVSA